MRVELCEEAIWLARQIVELQPDDESRGLLALLLLQHARAPSRFDESGNLVRFDEQDRSRWDAAALEEGRRLLNDADVTTLGPFRIEAAIAALHCAPAGPDWARIADLYGVLQRLAPSPIVDVNRAIAVASADGANAGLAIIDAVLGTGRLDRFSHAHAAHAELLERAGHTDHARAAWLRAIRANDNPAQHLALTDRLDALDSRST